MAVRPGYKKRYTREEYNELQRQEALAAWNIETLIHGGWSNEEAKKQLEANWTGAESALGIDSSDTNNKTVVSQGWYVLGAALIVGLGAGAIYRLGATKKG